MRKQFDGLAALVQEGLKRDPRSGDMFVFRNKRGDMMKVIFFDKQGYCLVAKRMDRGTFKFSAGAAKDTVEINAHDLAQLMRGMPI